MQPATGEGEGEERREGGVEGEGRGEVEVEVEEEKKRPSSSVSEEEGSIRRTMAALSACNLPCHRLPTGSQLISTSTTALWCLGFVAWDWEPCPEASW